MAFVVSLWWFAVVVGRHESSLREVKKLSRFDLYRRLRHRTSGVPAIPAAERAELSRNLAKTEGMIDEDEAVLLYSLAKRVESGCIVEVGSYRGRSAVTLAQGTLAGHKVPVFAIDPHEDFTGVLGGEFGPEDRAAFFRAMLETGGYAVVRLINSSSEIVTPGWKKVVSLLWIDGDHTYEGVKRDFECWLPHLAVDAHVVFDDSLDPTIGPKRLIDELLATRRFDRLYRVGKVTVLGRRES